MTRENWDREDALGAKLLGYREAEVQVVVAGGWRCSSPEHAPDGQDRKSILVEERLINVEVSFDCHTRGVAQLTG